MIAPPALTAMTRFRLPKGSGTYADALAAFGLQHLLEVLSTVRFGIADAGSDFELAAPNDEVINLDALDYAALQRSAGYRYVRLAKDATPSVAGEIEYAAERRLLLDWREARKKSPRPSPEDRQRLDALRPMANWMLYQNVNVLQGFGGYVTLHQQLRAADPATFRAAVRAQLARLAGQGDDVAASPFAVTAVQAFNPAVGKGVSGIKPKGTGLGGLPNVFVNWFVEWLRYAGLASAATSVALGDDIKIYVVAPAALDGDAVAVVGEHFGILGAAPTSAKSDVLLTIRLARALIQRSEAAQATVGSPRVRFRRRKPNQIVAGLHAAYFKSLGQSRALSNISFIGLPGWFPVEPDSYDLWLAVLEEHDRLLRALDEERTEEANLLAHYRDFLSAGPELIPALLTFLGDYAIHVFRILDRGRPVATPRLAVLDAFLRRLFMDQRQDLAPILDDTGFRHVAAAIRRATVSEQFQKAHQQQEYEIRYGLLQELQRKARFKDQFVAQLSDFIVGYNHENARKAEMAASAGRALRRRRPQVTTEDVARVVHLLDTYPSETVAMLLLAYAAASDPRTPEPAVEAAADAGAAAAAPETMEPDGAIEQVADESAE